MTKLEYCLLGAVIGLVGKVVWAYIQKLREPSIAEVKEIGRLGERLSLLEQQQITIEKMVNNKVDSTVWLERSAKLEGFSKQHNTELAEVRKELRLLREAIT